ncbi:MAG: hypothetical protein L0170_06855, partial [Acidobacteria bacterium]|nr:hypothetical protein [Acidobacteriota bacterium]
PDAVLVQVQSYPAIPPVDPLERLLEASPAAGGGSEGLFRVNQVVREAGGDLELGYVGEPGTFKVQLSFPTRTQD